MSTTPQTIRHLDDLRDYVNEVLCEHDELEVGAFSMTETILVRNGKPCGMFFCLHGPRAVKATAIWDALGGSVWFYGSSGARFHRTQLVAAGALELAAA